MRKAEHKQTESENGYSNLEIDTMLSEKVSISGDETINDIKTFVELPESTAVPSLDNQLVNKKYVDEKTRYIALAPVVISGTTQASMFSTSFSGPGLVSAANTLKVGQSFSVEFNGFSTTTVSAVSTMTVSFGGTTIYSGNTTYQNNRTNYYFYLKFLITIRSIGVNGTVIMQGHSILQTSDSGGIVLYPKALLSPVTINTTVNNAFDVRLQWGGIGQSLTVSNAIVVLH